MDTYPGSALIPSLKNKQKSAFLRISFFFFKSGSSDRTRAFLIALQPFSLFPAAVVSKEKKVDKEVDLAFVEDNM